MQFWRFGILVLLTLSIGYFAWLILNQPSGSTRNIETETKAELPSNPSNPAISGSNEEPIPEYVLVVLRYIRSNGRAPDGYVGGRRFQNREKKLSLYDSQGKPLRYQEWDVHPKVSGRNRGAERLITGSDNSAWYTADHYNSFKRIQP